MKKFAPRKVSNELLNRYIKGFEDNGIELKSLDAEFDKFKHKHKELLQFRYSVKDLMVLDFPHLYQCYMDYMAIDKTVREALADKDNGLLAKVFKYGDRKFYEAIKNFFLDKRNGFDVSVCVYCESAYTNVFDILKEENELFEINNSDADELSSYLKKQYRGDIATILSHRPYSDYRKMRADVNDSHFNAGFRERIEGKPSCHFDLDHVLDKGSCPLVALSLFNFVPSCSVCNSRLKHSRVLGRFGKPEQEICPTSEMYNFDEKVSIRLHSFNGKLYTNPVEHPYAYTLDFETDDDAYKYEIGLFKLKERYDFHKVEALRMLYLRQKYNDACLKLMSNCLTHQGNSINAYIPERIKEDIFGTKFIKGHHRIFEKMNNDIIQQLDECDAKITD